MGAASASEYVAGGEKMSVGYVAVSAAKNHFSVHFSDEAY